MKAQLSLLFTGLIVITFLSGFSPLGNSNQPSQKWQLLGSRKVNFGLDHDVIAVTAAEGTFSKLKIVVTGGSLNMYKMVVVYGNGISDEIELRHNFARRSTSREIDLRGGQRVIKEVVFWYDTKNVSNRRATLSLFGS